MSDLPPVPDLPTFMKLSKVAHLAGIDPKALQYAANRKVKGTVVTIGGERQVDLENLRIAIPSVHRTVLMSRILVNG